MKKTLIYFLIIFSILTCKSNSQNNDFFLNLFGSGKTDSNQRESSDWKYYSNDNKNLVETGLYKNGLKTGKWVYYFPNKDSIWWNPFYSKDSVFEFSVPDFLVLDSEEENFISFVHKNKMDLFKLKAGFSNTIDSNESYQKEVTKEIKENSKMILTMDSSRILTTCNNIFYYLQVTGIDKLNEKYSLFTINGVVNNIRIETTLRCSYKENDFGKTTFFSFFKNLYVQSNRFFDEDINCNVIINKVVNTRSEISFGCGHKN